jgi:hypothetical protein
MMNLADKRPAHEIARERVNMLAAELGLEIACQFVPFSQSRNAKPRAGSDKPWRSLNWRVTLSAKGREGLTLDYSQGEGYAPASKGNRFPDKWSKAAAVAVEIETGRKAKPDFGGKPYPGREPIPAPDIADILHCVAMDSGVLDYATFEDWASEYGYETDSRSAESTYRECLAHALAFRAMIGDAKLQELIEAANEM